MHTKTAKEFNDMVRTEQPIYVFYNERTWNPNLRIGPQNLKEIKTGYVAYYYYDKDPDFVGIELKVQGAFYGKTKKIAVEKFNKAMTR